MKVTGSAALRSNHNRSSSASQKGISFALANYRQIIVLFAQSGLWHSLCEDWLRSVFYCYILIFGKTHTISKTMAIVTTHMRSSHKAIASSPSSMDARPPRSPTVLPSTSAIPTNACQAECSSCEMMFRFWTKTQSTYFSAKIIFICIFKIYIKVPIIALILTVRVPKV